MGSAKKTYRKLTDADLAEIAAEYRTKRAFYDGDSSAFVTAARRGILSDISTHMFTGRFKWTKEMILNEAKKYKTRTDFANGSRAAYTAAKRRGFFDEACAHMPRYVSKKQKEKEAAA